MTPQQKQTQWFRHPQAETFILERLDQLLADAPPLRDFQTKLALHTNIRLPDWLDHLVLADGDGELVSGAEMELEGTMTHAGMVPVLSAAEEKEPGRYEAELKFTMGGDWVVIVYADLADGTELEKEIDLPGVKTP
jgi:hypothetical protein